MRVFLLAVLSFALVACSDNPPIVGRWKELRGPGLESREPDVVEFLADGTVQPDGYTWRMEESGRVTVEGAVLGRDPVRVGVIEVSGDEFTITTEAGEAVFRRADE